MNIQEKEKYIEELKAGLEKIRYPKNPFADYVILPEYFYSDINGPESATYIENAAKAFKIAKSLSSEVVD
jgi:hypothetical protein